MQRMTRRPPELPTDMNTTELTEMDSRQYQQVPPTPPRRENMDAGINGGVRGSPGMVAMFDNPQYETVRD